MFLPFAGPRGFGPKKGRVLMAATLAALEALRDGALAELRSAMHEARAGHVEDARDWASAFGEPYPETVEDWERWAARVGVSPDWIIKGEWKPEDIFPLIEGYVQRRKDAVARAPSPPPAAGQAGPAARLQQIADELRALSCSDFRPAVRAHIACELLCEALSLGAFGHPALAPLRVALRAGAEPSEAVFPAAAKALLGRTFAEEFWPHACVYLGNIVADEARSIQARAGAAEPTTHAEGEPAPAAVPVPIAEPAAGGLAAEKGKRKPRITKDEANVRAREALKGRVPKGKRRWSQRTLAKAIGCAVGQVPELPAWQAYAEEHGLKRDKGDAAPKPVSLTEGTLAKQDSAAASERLRLAQLERVAAEQIADGAVDRKRYPRRRKV